MYEDETTGYRRVPDEIAEGASNDRLTLDLVHRYNKSPTLAGISSILVL